MPTATMFPASWPEREPAKSESTLDLREKVRFAIEGVRAPIVATVAKRRADGLVLVQKLPFLKRDSLVCDDTQRQARIARVALDSGRDVPELVIELAYDDPAPSIEEPTTLSDVGDLPLRHEIDVRENVSSAAPERSLAERLRAAFRAFTGP